MTEARRRMGAAAEELVATRLEAAGWSLVARNARSRQGEIDLIARDGERLVFVEVKAGRAGSGAGPERPALAVGPAKQRRLRRLAAAWLAANGSPPGCREFGFDVVGVTYRGDGTLAEVDHIRDAF